MTEPTPQRRSITQIVRMVYWSYLGKCLGELVDDLCSAVPAAIIDHQHFVIVSELRKNFQCGTDQRRDSLLIVEGRKEDTYTSLAERGKHYFSLVGSSV